ncbi:drug/metabolite exporter YedA [Pseudonocardia sulfidoxydans NBRC 16205]|uniref:Drug/metabolite exporter YedA n=1 Tax=Pseudonocardia sulfidoxydans NBRC 16205 TaxID=1223511 RepID=A0A511DNU2_9PSEU|nr:EamA family transporter [Pseudonocardia sulfidoxydans]GEL26482.1 drug/metabolite exporter YedA [Pseudonocardia sulfidoxydans NBRC 16205]
MSSVEADPATTQRIDRPGAAWIAMVVVYVVWGSTYLGNKIVIVHVPPLLTGGFRFLVGGIAMTVLLLVWRGPSAFRLTRAQFLTCALTGLLLPAWGNGLVTLGQQNVSSGLAALLIASVPLWIVLLRRMTGDRPRPATFLGVAIGIVGLAVLLLAGSSAGSAGTSGNAWWGPWVVLLAGLGWAVGTFAATKMATPTNPLTLVAVQMTIGGVILLAVGFGKGDRLDVGSLPAATWWAWAYMALIASCLGFSAFAYTLNRLPVSTVATYAYVNPVIAVLLGVVVAGERFSPLQVVGGLVVVAAVVLVVAAERKPSVEAPPPT